MSETRKLAAILVADVVGYSRLAGAVAEFRWIEEMDYDLHWRRTLIGELDIVFLSCKAAWPWLIRRGGGAIVNLASANAYVALKHSPALAHCAGKGGVL